MNRQTDLLCPDKARLRPSAGIPVFQNRIRLRWAAWLLLALVGIAPCRADDWPQWLGPHRDGIWRETGIVKSFPPGGPPVLWRTAIGTGFAGPAVTQGRVFVMDRTVEPGGSNPANPTAKKEGTSLERVLCLDDKDGQILWKYAYPCAFNISYPSGPRTTPAVDHGKVYTLGAVGDLCCLEAGNGQVVWSRQLRKDYGVDSPVWGFAGHPLVDGKKLICLVRGDGSTVVAFDKDTGKELWRALSAREPGYCPPVIYEAGGKRQLIVWDPESVNSLDPETGKVYWSIPFAVNTGMSIATPRRLGDLLLVTCFYNGSLMLRLADDQPAATELWRGRSNSEIKTDGLHSVFCTPFIEDGYIYGVCSYGQLRCLKAGTGERVWETYAATGGKHERWASAFIVKNGDRFFLFNEKGDLIIAKLSPKGYDEISRAHLLAPTNSMPGRDVVWSHPAFANRCMYARNDKEIICVNLGAP
ncbi:MAG: PQQ-like beta-propeller repeat protein [Candidatus Omnitrophica bacterium]|nr:PQQ-like beta-propeller repeat protein [Candidatus Omnitrophota bacterium]